jgi:hypothetical protein
VIGGLVGQLQKQFQKLIDRHFGISKYLAKQAAAHILSGMIGDTGDPPVTVFEPNMTTFLPCSHKPGIIQGLYDLISLQDG